jgi:hypothetical protein
MNAYEQRWYPVARKETHADEPRHRSWRLLGLLRYLLPPFFFCWHRRMSRPFTRDGETYRVCLRCGIRREFDVKQWQTKGSYYRPANKPNQNEPSQEPKPRYQLVKGGIGLDAERRRVPTTIQCSIRVDGKPESRYLEKQ